MNAQVIIKKHPFERAGLGIAPFRCVGFEVAKYQACQGAPIQPGSSCDYCGTGIMNVFKVKSADGRTFKVGCDCVEKTGDHTLVAEVKEIKSANRRANKEARRAAKREAFKQSVAERFAQLPAEFHAAIADCDHPIVQDIAGYARRYGRLSVSQLALVEKLYGEFLARRDAVGCALPPPVEAPRTDKRVLVEGRVLGVKVQESMYGETLKMLIGVRTPDGEWKGWSTVPAGLYKPKDGWKGLAVVLKARIEVSKDDPCFAFLSRPTLVSPKEAT